MLPTQTDFPAEVVATPVIWDGATAFILSILSAVAAAVIANWLGVNGERRRQEVVLVTIIKRKYEIILQASERAIRAVGDGEPAARELVATVRRELGFVLTICSGLPLKKLDDALDGKAADKPKPKPPEPSPPPVRPIPISYKLEEAKVLTSGLCGTGVEDGYVVTEAAPPPPPAPPPCPSPQELVAAHRIQIRQAVEAFHIYWSDRASRISELSALQRAFATTLPPKVEKDDAPPLPRH
ncbi:MAG: hypothetical protein U1C74_30545 [Phenylobacterium sp.]|jgi:hypothetical protein|uniref:Uncharacterized protein n=1 Tax=Brevundimonas mediterranea TaxID=74329 RepID=A0AB37E680_9CAUL|nr:MULTISPECIES: hypothetical protein [Brevundimonas]EDX79896.1 hypothetical protein BBAL3_1053 [Brevundimonas sp. BAL3]MDZ4322248.1 hypothetical protein [Phenylobacterium sp.]MDZ4375743.1 hypothetical protein [Phenylobacterium sp.]QIH72495.1 hypothetical protein GYM46_05745 [Brevundimonas mediterranea]